MVAVPVALVVTTVAQVPDEIALVPKVEVPEAIVCARVEDDGIVVPFTLVVDDRDAGMSPAVKARNAGAPAVANSAWVVVVSAEMVEGVAPAPPPIMTAFDVSSADEAHPEELLKYGMPPDVPATVSASVPFVVTGEPATEISPPVNVSATLVTVPVPTEHPLVVRFLLPSVQTGRLAEVPVSCNAGVTTEVPKYPVRGRVAPEAPMSWVLSAAKIMLPFAVKLTVPL